MNCAASCSRSEETNELALTCYRIKVTHKLSDFFSIDNLNHNLSLITKNDLNKSFP